ncbi:TonB-dependent receptor [Sphingobium phenoxybenzoativorans]|uniref:TonB-dependent receptor n=1 Tax=Sphingobium phenoxybenzoativorans TaxID=1592790 RepID=UPI0008729393|nr:TonB-dependent receptor [Sphingobium phenoxybenzoativorans]
MQPRSYIGRKRLSGGIALMLTTAFCGMAQAQDESPAATQQAPQADDAQGSAAGDIIVTAQRREQRLNDVPLSVQAKTGETLTQAGVTDSRALEQISPAVNFNAGYTPTATSVVIRGAASLAQEGGIQPSVGVVIDNVPVGRQAEFIVDLADIDRVEVLSGPQGTLFGKNSTAGVVNIITNRPKRDFGASFEATGTTDEEVIAKGMLNVPVGERVSARVNGYYHYLSPLIENLGTGGDLWGQRSYGMQGKLLFDISDTTNLLLTANYNKSRSSAGVQFVITPISEPIGTLQTQTLLGLVGRGVDVVNQDTQTYNKSRSYAFIGELNSELSDSLSLVAISGYRNFSSRTEIEVDNGPTGVNPGRGFSPNPLGYPISYVAFDDDHLPEQYKYFSQEVRLNYTGNGIDAVVGGYFQDFEEKRNLILPFVFDGAFALADPSLAGVLFYNDTRTQSRLKDKTIAAFADVTYEIVPTVKVFAGIRYTHEKLNFDYAKQTYFNPVAGFFDPVTQINSAPPVGTFNVDNATRSDNNISGRVGIQWQPQRNLNYYASFNRSYKGAAAYQGTGLSNAADALIAPEIAEAFEIGAKQRFFDGALSIDIALYSQKIKNIQQTAVLPGTVTTQLVNAGDLKIKGFELNSSLRPVDGLTLNAALVYNDSQYSGDNFFPCGPSATPGVGQCGANGLINLNGRRAISSPRVKVVTSATYDIDLEGPLKIRTYAAYNWRSSNQFQLYQDPLTKEPAYGILDASIGLGDDDDRWSLTIFGKNLTNKFYYAYLNTADFFIGRQFGGLTRDYKRYGGLRLTYKM